MPEFNKRGFVYISAGDMYPGNHPDWGILKTEGFTVPLVRPPETDLHAYDIVKSARGAGLLPSLWEAPHKKSDTDYESAEAFADRLNDVVGKFDSNGAYVYSIVADNEKLPVEWHRIFAPRFAGYRTRQKILSIDPLQADVWNDHNLYEPYINSGWSIDVQCYDDRMNYFDVARCWSIVCACPGVKPWKVRVTLPPGQADVILPTLLKMGPIGVGVFAPSMAQVTTDLPKYGDYILSSNLPKAIAYK